MPEPVRSSGFGHALAASCLALFGTFAAAQSERLVPGEPVEGVVAISRNPDATSYVSYVFDVDNDVIAFSIELHSSADLDLYLDSSYIDDYSDVLQSSSGYSGTERMLFDLSNVESIGKEYHIDVAYGRLDPPVGAEGHIIDRIPYTLTVTPYRQLIDASIEPGDAIAGRIDPTGRGPVRSYVIDVPNGTPELRVDLASDATDLDLRIRHAKPMRTTRDADAAAVSWAGSETIIIDNGNAPIASGRYYIDVFDQVWLDWPAEFRLIATYSDAPPEDFIDLPVLTNNEGLAGAVNATVEILHDDGGGSGVLLSDTGFVLTNHHVIELTAESGLFESTDQLLVGLTVDPSTGSHVRMKAGIVAVDRNDDLALLRIETDLYGNPLPAGYRFPAISLADPGALTLGDPLHVIGYPDAGSLGTRVSITLTRGIVSGFERRGDKLIIKTDADIASGNSGGPVLNSDFGLIGLATEAISEEFGNSQIGYIYPLWLVPEEWWEIVRAAE